MFCNPRKLNNTTESIPGSDLQRRDLVVVLNTFRTSYRRTGYLYEWGLRHWPGCDCRHEKQTAYNWRMQCLTTTKQNKRTTRSHNRHRTIAEFYRHTSLKEDLSSFLLLILSVNIILFIYSISYFIFKILYGVC